MKCPHCLVEFHDKVDAKPIGEDDDGVWGLLKRLCPNCNRFILQLAKGKIIPSGGQRLFKNPTNEILIHPKTFSRTPLSPAVPNDFSQDYREACVVLADSPKASAALSRRCLQLLLRSKAGVKNGALASEIQEVMDSSTLPSHLSDSLDAIRNIGNFAAHPIKSKSTGEIVEVETGEAEWNLDVLEALFDFYFVQPALLKEKRDALNKKLADVGKPPMK
jgi:hypothetical protein